VFVRTESTWQTMTETARLISSDSASGDMFGLSVAVSGNMVMVGAPQSRISSNPKPPAAYLFIRPGNKWKTMMETENIIAPDAPAKNFFGRSVTISGNMVVVESLGNDKRSSEPGNSLSLCLNIPPIANAVSIRP